MNRKLVLVKYAYMVLYFLICISSSSITVKAPSGYPIHDTSTRSDYAAVHSAIEANTTLDSAVLKTSVSSGWYYRDMNYRVEHNISGSSSGIQKNYQMRITIVNGSRSSSECVYYTTHVNQSDFDDVKFTWYNATKEKEEEIDYWREEVNSKNNATFWVEIPEVSNITDNTIYAYYGNNSTATASDVNSTFIRVIDGNQPVVLALPMDEESGSKTFDQSGNDNDGTLHPQPLEVSNCDNTTGWSGTSLSSETNDKVEGSASVVDTITSPTSGTDYDTSYNPPSSWDWSSKKHIILWLKCNRASTAFANASLVLIDTSNLERYWDISFDANAWTRIEEKLELFDGEDTGFDLSAVDKVVTRFKTADTSDFHKLVDYIQIDDSPQRIDGKFGKALSFDGEDDYVEVTDVVGLRPSHLAVEVWMKPDTIAGTGVVVTKKESGVSADSYAIRKVYGDLEGWVRVDGTHVTVSESGCLTTDWHHVVLTYDLSDIRLYFDGVEVDSTPCTGAIQYAPNNLHIGWRNWADYPQWYRGDIDEVRIYNRSLTQEEISDLYNNYGYTTTDYAGRVLVRKRVDPEPHHGPWGSEVRYVPVHDVAVVDVVSSSTEVIKGHSIDILVEVENDGTESETFNVTVYCNSNDIDSQINVSLEPEDNRVLTFTWNTIDFFPDSYNVYAQVSAVSGEIDTEDNFFTDGTIVVMDFPKADFSYSPLNPIVNETVTFNATASNANGGTIINYAWKFGDGEEGSDQFATHTYNKFGTYNVTMTITDSEGLNNTAWETITIKDYPEAYFTYSPINPFVNGTMTFNATLSAPNGGTIINCTWDFGDGFYGDGVVVYHNYSNFGIFNVTLTVSDSEGLNGTAWAIITLKDYPVAYFVYSPINPLVNETAMFNATLSSPNGGVLLNYTWDFGDGFFGDGAIAFHNYSRVGTYNVTLTVIDSKGLNDTTWAIVAVLIHSVTVVNVTPSTNEIFEGQTMNVTVVVQNNGNFTETFNVVVYANTFLIQTQIVPDLAPTAQAILTFIWNTAGVLPGEYTIVAETSVTPGETYATQTITVHTPASGHMPLVMWLIGIHPFVWVSISVLIIMVALFRLKIIEIRIESPLESPEQLQLQVDRLLQPLIKKDKRFVLLQQFLNQLLTTDPPPETLEFIQNTLHALLKQ